MPPLGPRALLACAGFELEGKRVDAVALTGGSGAVGEDVAEVTATVGTGDLGPTHAERAVVVFHDDPVVDRLGEAGPTRPRVELVVGAEQLGATDRKSTRLN